MRASFQEILIRYLMLWLSLLCTLAFFWSDLGISFDPFAATRPHIPKLFALTMFTVGCLMSGDEISEVFHNWPTVISGTAVQYTVMPLASYAVGHLLPLDTNLLLGVIIVGCVPGAMASNVLTLTARGNVSYSVSLTTAATMISPILVPLALFLAVGSTGVDRWKLTTDAVGVLLWQVIGPVVLGHMLSRAFSRLSGYMRTHGPTIANASILWLIATIVYANREKLAGSNGALSSSTLLLLLAGLFLINAVGYLGGYFGGRLVHLPEAKRRALAIEVGMQNAGLGSVLASQLFPETPTVALPAVVYMFGCMLTGTLLAQIWSYFPPEEPAPHTAT